ncbi:MAG: hypothetical protein WCF24_06595 [Acidimicrobiales bacterium]
MLLSAAVAALAFGLAACGGPGSPGVASLGKSSGNGGGGTTTTTLPTGNPSDLVDQWASCMRSHGDPGQVDPTIDANKVIHVTFPTGYHSTSDGLGGPCGNYMAAAQMVLRGGKPLKTPDRAELVKFSDCMRANGIADFPYPTASGGLVLSVGGDLSPNNPAFRHASKVCAEKTGVPGFGGTPQPGMVAVSGGGPPCNAKRTAGANALRGGMTGANRAELVTFLEC